ncbi:uri1, prefoldin-like chaperone [Mortierella claussenii]|nr:uri1, prefoldin-like chaperone [Mortierella claussenii]
MDHSQEQLREEEAAELAGYFAKFSAALTQLEDELARWKNYETDYQALKTTLLDLPKEISHPVMVPIGNLAFMPGKLVHTNEILVMLGDNWFVDRSAVQAAEIVDRRMEFVQENITRLQAQEEQIRSKSGIAPGLLGGQEYNEEGLPIVEITEPYFSDDEDGKDDSKSNQSSLLPFSQKTAKEQAEDRAILDRIAELEREDEERERRREAGEIVTSDEDTESEDDVPADYDDGESEDEFRPKALDSDEEYEEEVWEHSGNEDDEEEDGEEDHEEDSLAKLAQGGRKSVRFADLVAKATKNNSKPLKSSSASAVAAATSTSASTPPTSKPKSPTDLINQMKAKQQAVRSSAASDQMVNMANLEATFAGMSAGGVSTMKAPIFEEETPSPVGIQQAPLKSALKPPSKKMSLFKQQQQQRAQNEAGETVKETSPAVVQGVQKATPPKKMSKFAMDRAAASAEGKASTSSASPASVQSALGGVSERVFEKNVASPVMAAADKSNTPGVFDVIERNITPAAPVKQMAPVVVPATTPAVPSITKIKDVIENTFTKPSTLTDTEPVTPTTGRKKPSLFRRQQQQAQPSAYLEPEAAVPESSFVGVEDDEDEAESHRSISAIPSVVSARSIAQSSSQTKESIARPLETKLITKSSATPAQKKIIPVVPSSKLKDTPLMKGAIVEHEEFEPVDEDELEEDMLMRQVVSEYQQRRQDMIAQYGAYKPEDIERMWEQQVVIPQGMIIPEHQHIQEIDDQFVDAEEDEEDEEEGEQHERAVVDDRNLPPKKLSLFRAARLSGTLAKE